MVVVREYCKVKIESIKNKKTSGKQRSENSIEEGKISL